MSRMLPISAMLVAALATPAARGDDPASSYAFAPCFQGFQHGSYVGGYPSTNGYGPGWYGGWGGRGYGGYRSSTIAEGYLRGMGDLVQSWGQYNLMTSQGMVAAEQTRQLALQNDSQAVETYFHNRRVNSEARRAEAGPKLTAVQVERINQSRTPARLTAAQLGHDGAIEWPAVLEQPKYDALRNKLSGLFANRVNEETAPSLSLYRHVQMVTQSFKALLRDEMSNLSSGDYLAARRFLDSLAHEARFAPAQGAEVATR